MATYEASSDDWWESVPCHFIWNLEEKVTVHFRSVKTNLDSQLETRKDVNWSDSACDLLLFRGYLEVSDFVGVQRNFSEAEQFFGEADREAMKTTDELERNAYVTVAAADRLWALKKKKTGQDEVTPDERESLLKVLEDSWKKYQDDSESRDKINAYIDTVAAFALSRLGVFKYKEAEGRYRHAMRVLGESAVKSSWYQSVGMLIGRQSKHAAGPSPEYSEIENEIWFYKKALEIDPNNQSARCDLALALGRIPDRVQEAKEIIQQVDQKYCEILVKKSRFFRGQKEYEACLHVLKDGDKLASLTAKFYHQFALVYKDLTQNEKNFEKKREYSQKEAHYLDKGLEIDPMNIGVLLDRAFLYSRRGQSHDAKDLYFHIMREFESSLPDLLTAQYRYAQFMVHWNRRRMNVTLARAFEDVIETACSIVFTMGSLGNDTATNKFVLDSKKRLEEYYQANGERQKLQDLWNRTSPAGF